MGDILHGGDGDLADGVVGGGAGGVGGAVGGDARPRPEVGVGTGGGGGTEAVSIEVEDVEKVVVLGNGVAGRRIEIPLGEVKTCSPWAPFLYGFPVRVEDGVFPVWTAWTEGEIWLRREFELDDVGVGDLMLEILNNGDATVYLNGVDLGKRGGWSPLYRLTVLGDKAEAALRKGRNVIAVKVGCGRLRRFIDVGLVGYE